MNAVQGAAIVFSLDRMTKFAFRDLPMDWVAQLPTSFTNIITFVDHKNYGIIANFPLPLTVTVAVTVLVIIIVLGATWTAIRDGKKEQAFALGVLLGGAAGNLFDRVRQGYVFDWMLLFGRSAINLADIAIVLGALYYFISRRRDDQREITAEPIHM